VARLAHYFDIAFNLQQRGQRPENQRLILGNEHANHPAAPLTPGTGRRRIRRIPSDPSRSSVPPSVSTRSRMPLRPNPSGSEPPRPSSAISSSQPKYRQRSANRQDLAPAWRTTLVTASRIARASTLSCDAETVTGSTLA